MDLLEMIRLRNMFSPAWSGDSDPAEAYQSMQLDNPVNQTSNVTPEMSMTQPYNYQPEHAMLDRETQMLNDFPQRGNPGVLQKIFASMYGAAHGPQAAEQYAQGPYYEKLADWKAQFGPVNQAATQERYANTNERQMATSQANQDRLERALLLREKQGATRLDQGQQRIDETAEKNKTTADLNERKFKLQQELANGGTIKEDDKGHTFLVTKDGKIKDVSDTFDNLSFEEKETIKGRFATERAAAVTKAREDNKRDRLMRGTFEDPDNPGKTIYGVLNLDTKEITPLAAPGGEHPRAVGTEPNTAGEQAGDVTNTALKVKTDNPQWAKYIHMKNNKFTGIEPPAQWGSAVGWMSNSPDQDTYDKIRAAIYGEGPTNRAAGTKTSSQSTAQIPKGYKPDDKIRVKNKKTGETGTLLFKDFTSQKYEMLSQ